MNVDADGSKLSVKLMVNIVIEKYVWFGLLSEKIFERLVWATLFP